MEFGPCLRMASPFLRSLFTAIQAAFPSQVSQISPQLVVLEISSTMKSFHLEGYRSLF